MRTGAISIILLFTLSICHAQRVEPFTQWSPAQSKDEIHDWFLLQRAFPYGTTDAEAHRAAARLWIDSNKRSNRITASWQSAGPVNIGGRLTDVEMTPGSTGTIFVCGASGGIFRSFDNGSVWQPVFDDQPSLSIGDLAISPSDTGILYAGTGEPNAGGGSLTYDGAGVFRSTDGGDNWTSIGLTTTRNIGRIAVHPDNPDTLFVAAMGDLFSNNTDRGLFRSFDGGTTWSNVLQLNDSTGVIDVCIDPSRPNRIFACTWTRVRRIDRRNYGGPASGLWRSDDYGSTWTAITGTGGLPTAFSYGRTCIGISATNPDLLYYLVADQQSAFQGVYRSLDGGITWTRTNDSQIGDIFNGAAHWECRLRIDPTDGNIVYLAGFDCWKTSDGGQQWYNISSNEHPDNHEIFVDPQQHDHILLANDGGLFTSYDGGNSWMHTENLPVTQFYTGEVNEADPLERGGGTQDNGVQQTTTGLPDDWYPIWGGDGFYVLFDPVNGITYCESQYGNLNTGTNGVDPSDRFNWNTPLAFNPLDYSTVFLGSNRLYVSYDFGNNWTVISPDLTTHTYSGYPITWGTITTISISPADTNVIYCGTDDGHIWVTTDHGNTWQPVDPMAVPRWITRVTADPVYPGTVYATISGYRFADPIAHVYKSTDFGMSWLAIASGLPDVPCNDLVIDPDLVNTLYVATDAGVYVSVDAGSNWAPAGQGLPVVPVTDLRAHSGTRTLFAATYGRSMWTLPLVPLPTNIVSNEAANTKAYCYPNPFSEQLKIRIEGFQGQARATVTRYDGVTIASLDISADAWIELGDIFTNTPAGCYLLNFADGKRQTTLRIIKER